LGIGFVVLALSATYSLPLAKEDKIC